MTWLRSSFAMPRLRDTTRLASARLPSARFATALCGLVLLSACVSPTPASSPDSARAASEMLALPPMKLFADRKPAQSRRSNASLARDFLDLTFVLETGAELTQFTRFEDPITLRVTGDTIPPSLPHDLTKLLTRLEREAGVTITPVPPQTDAAITLETLTLAELSRRAPNTACIVVPNVSSWAEFKRARRAALSWTKVDTRERLSIFIPVDVAPQEIRDCLHEELAQALGPLNDLYRLPDSVFNDDNIHSVLTPFDMLMLRLTYAPELRSGMSRDEVARALPDMLARINPVGETLPDTPTNPTPRLWTQSVLAAMGRAPLQERLLAAQNAVAIAQAEGWDGTRAGFSWFLLGRLAIATDRPAAYLALTRAAEIYGAHPETRFHAAHVTMQLAALALSEHRYEDAYTLSASAIDAARDAENAALLASLMLTEAEALENLGRSSDARALRLDSLGWARYGFGSDEEVRIRAAEIAALAR
ncbi:DUF2927 domain-containing protein [Celeribacter halophilus]|uniref:ATP-dependent transcriptional regulator n=1 Tax=Celeribacter halophilus TaxID=576117 RepID=A0A1I3Q5T6_9RHOB|nr:DUF2927 domain-containing protein [Celeribacter halophilus]PZX14079.1 Protein of unknown function (DUF2927) [Celeribacter halophilus]SFJ29353.1 Protein of unknown function [Celeribacter halophilus]